MTSRHRLRSRPGLFVLGLSLLAPAVLGGCGEGDGGEPRGDAPADSVAAPAPAAPEQQPVPDGADSGTVVGTGVWTVGRSRGGPEDGPGQQPPTVTAMRTSRHDGFDRFVLELDPAGGLPGFTAEYIDRPVRECGSGRTVELPGDGWLELHLIGARAHDDDGRPTVTTREGSPRLPNLLAHDMTCDFEGQVEWVLAVASPEAFRVLDLRDPWRLVVDVRH